MKADEFNKLIDTANERLVNFGLKSLKVKVSEGSVKGFLNEDITNHYMMKLQYGDTEEEASLIRQSISPNDEQASVEAFYDNALLHILCAGINNLGLYNEKILKILS